jgi:hypothetical protein
MDEYVPSETFGIHLANYTVLVPKDRNLISDSSFSSADFVSKPV